MKTLFRAAAAAICLQAALCAVEPLSTEESAVLAAITANQIKGHVSFLASDALEGRDTPSRGLEIAAEYIASSYRRFGLKPALGSSYFQDGYFYKLNKQPMDQFTCVIDAGEKGKFTLNAEKVRISDGKALDLSASPAVKVSLATEETALPAKAEITGKVVLLEIGGSIFNPWVQARRREIQKFGPAAIVEYTSFLRQAPQRLPNKNAPGVRTNDPDFQKFLESVAGPVQVSLRLQAPEEEKITLRNVVGVLEGSDPTLKDTYLLLTAHYDHVGVNPRTPGDDKIFNGANDNASGTSTILALAEAFSRSPARPKRSIVFIAYSGEEIGLFGSRFYAMEPLFPLRNTIANLNFEQMGRTDDTEGARVGQITASGIDYTTLGDTLAASAALVDVKTWKHPRYSDEFFSRSDNQALADAGVPAITLAVAWQYPDYHRPTDHWDKLDYQNFEAVARAVAIAAWRVANDPQPVRWAEGNASNQRYRRAWEKLQEK